MPVYCEGIPERGTHQYTDGPLKLQKRGRHATGLGKSCRECTSLPLETSLKIDIVNAKRILLDASEKLRRGHERN